VRDRPQAVGGDAEYFQIPQQAVSQHLQALVDAGLVEARADGRRRLYVIDEKRLEAWTRSRRGRTKRVRPAYCSERGAEVW
jgi:DNA-binding transcriptional ArsR family regulator